MATVRKGNKGVLLVVDMQAGVLSESWDAARIIQSVSRAVERARAQVAPVIWVQHSDDDLPYGVARPTLRWLELRPTGASVQQPMPHWTAATT